MKFCDLKCEYAEWPDKLADGSKTCRTFVAINCKKLKRLVHKNSLCQWEQENASQEEVVRNKLSG